MKIEENQNRNLYVVLNPVAGTSDQASLQDKITSILEKRNLTYDLYVTSGEEDLEQVIHSALRSGYDLFLVAGGDGTFSAVANGLVDSDAELGIIPTGTGNAFARELRIPLDVEKSLNALLEKHDSIQIDALKVRDRYYFLNVSAGVGSKTVNEMKRNDKRKLGILAYLWNGLKVLFGYQPQHFDLHIDDSEISFRAATVIVANTGIVGFKYIQLNPDIRFDDGNLKVCQINANNLLDYLLLVIRTLLRKQHQSKNITCYEAQHQVEIHSRSRLPLQADGEFIGYTPVRVQIHKAAVKILVPVS